MNHIQVIIIYDEYIMNHIQVMTSIAKTKLNLSLMYTF
jgi:hypothetical protein